MKMKRLFAVLLSILLVCGLFGGTLSASAAGNTVCITGFDTLGIEESVGGLFFFYLYLDQDIQNARHFQSPERLWEPEVPEDSWDFPDALTDAARSKILINDVPLGDYIDALGGYYGTVFCYEKAKPFGYKQTLTIGLDRESVPGVNPATDDFVIEIKNGMITAELKRFEACKLIWNHTTQKLTIERASDATTTTTTTAKPTTTTKPKANATTTTGAVATTTTVQDDITTTTVDGTTTTTAPVDVPAMNIFSKEDVFANNANITVDYDNNKIKLDESMTIAEFMAAMKIDSAYTAGVYNGPTEVDASTAVYTGYNLKIYDGEDLVGKFALEAPVVAANNGWIVWVIVAVAVLAAAGVVSFLVLRKKKV